MTLDELYAAATVERDQGFRGWPAPYAQSAVTLEDAEFLHALVRVTKPAVVLELGTGLGISGRFIAEALAVNGNGGFLHTYEPSASVAESPDQLLPHGDLPVAVWVGEEPDDLTPDLVFIDSGIDYRTADIRHWTACPFDVLIVVHDANRDYGLDDRCGVFLPGTDGLWIGRPG